MTFPAITEAYAGDSATGVAGESTFGTGVPPTSFLPMTSNTFEVDPGLFTPEVMQAVRDGQIYPLYGESTYNGTIAGPVFPSNGIQLLIYAIGTDAVTGTTAPYTHTITQANQLKSVTVEKNIGNVQSLRFAGVRINKLGLKAVAGNTAAEMTVDGIGQSAAIVGTPAAVSVVNELPFVFSEASLTLFGNLRAEVSSVDFNLDNTVKATYTFAGLPGPGFITPTKLHCSGTIDLVWSSLNASTYGDFQAMINQTTGALAFALTHPVAANGSVAVTCPKVALSKYSNDLKIGDVVMASLNYEAFKPLPSGNTVSAVVTNGVSTAY